MRRAGFLFWGTLMLAQHGTLMMAVVVTVLLLWAVGARRRMQRLRRDARRAFEALDDMLDAQHQWIKRWCAPPRADHRPPAPLENWLRLLSASVEQAGLALQRLRRNPLDAAAMDGLYQARRALQAAWLAGADRAPAPADGVAPVWPPEDWVGLVHQEVPLAAAFNARVATYNAAVSQFPALLLAILLRYRKARVLRAVASEHERA